MDDDDDEEEGDDDLRYYLERTRSGALAGVSPRGGRRGNRLQLQYVQELPTGGVSVIFPGRTGGGRGFRPMTPPPPPSAPSVLGLPDGDGVELLDLGGGSGGMGQSLGILPPIANLNGFKVPVTSPSTVPPLFMPSGPSARGGAVAAARRLSQLSGSATSGKRLRTASDLGSDLLLDDDKLLAELEDFVDVAYSPWPV